MEYVNLTAEEQTFAKKHLLHTQMEILSIMKRYQSYKKLRKLELALKSLLRKKITEVNQEVEIIDRVIPHVKKMDRPQEEKEKILAGAQKRDNLELEIEEIKRKIERLNY